eukprot:TRINITY_DN1452_c0_g2_i3.p1 TRINITY_DN1452_c0_g2~~TRINITY_DN1452_c0_g2_i3.p1  ORF type:complete len:448 (+),score=76.86 TRINITY_DN1452_c0_g2_i3:49-1392(+)
MIMQKCVKRSLRLASRIPLPKAHHRRLFGTSRPDCDVAIVGGGVMGSSLALHLAAASRGDKRIVVFESDATYGRAAAPRSAGGIRQQFSLATNIELSLYGIDFLKGGLARFCEGTDVDTDVQFRENGYLLLASPGEGEAILRENLAVQHKAGCHWITFLDAAGLKERFPWLNTDGLAAGAFGERNEGYFDPWALLQAMKKGAVARGVKYVNAKVSGFKMAPGKGGAIQSVLTADGSEYSVGTVVNTAGPWGAELVKMCGEGVTPLPVAPRKRCMFAIHTSAEVASDGSTPRPPDNTPLTINTNGVYVRSEGSSGRFLCGVSPKPEDDPDCPGTEEMDIVNHELFEEVIWPSLAERVPALEALKVESSWAGFYEYNTLDQNGVVGWHPDVPNLLIGCGFSGHGLQQAPGVGRALTELIVDGGYRTIDLTSFGYDRIVKGEPIYERGIY